MLPRRSGHWLRIGRYWYGFAGLVPRRLPVIAGAHNDPTVDQNAWGEILDDGSETGSTINSEDTVDGGWTQDVDVIFRARIEMVETSGNQVQSRNFQLQFDHNLVGFVAVGAATPLQAAISADTSWTMTDGEVTTDRLSGSGQTFFSGEYSEDGQTATLSVPASNHSEYEFCLMLDSAQVSNGDTFDLRCILSGSQGTPTYGATPTITANAPGAPGVNDAEKFFGELPPTRKRMPNLAGMTPGFGQGGEEISRRQFEAWREWRRSLRRVA